MSNVLEFDVIDTSVTMRVCPFRPTTRTIQISQNEMQQILDYPECYYKSCPYYDINNEIKCLKAESTLIT